MGYHQCIIVASCVCRVDGCVHVCVCVCVCVHVYVNVINSKNYRFLQVAGVRLKLTTYRLQNCCSVHLPGLIKL